MSGYGAYIYEGVLRGRSDKAILVDFGDDEYWLPVSVIGAFDDVEIGQALRLEIPEWLLDARGIS